MLAWGSGDWGEGCSRVMPHNRPLPPGETSSLPGLQALRGPRALPGFQQPPLGPSRAARLLTLLFWKARSSGVRDGAALGLAQPQN